MLEIIVILVYLSHLVALARSRGRSPAWALGGLLVWLLGDLVGSQLAGGHGVLPSALGFGLALVGGLLYHRAVHRLRPVEGIAWARGGNFRCPCCASLQTEDRSGHLACNACGSEFGWPGPAIPRGPAPPR